MSSVTIGMTTKGINSTSRVMSGGVSLDCRLKEPCGLHDPVFIVKGLSKSYNNYNFASWRGRYYWVNEIVFLTNDIQEVHCSLDPLATYKGAIDDTYAFVQYGSNMQNEWADDPRFNPEKEDTGFSYVKNFSCIPSYSAEGTVVMRFMDCGNGGGMKTWAVSYDHFNSMFQDMYALFNGKTIEEISAYVGGVGSWRDNILSATWLPIDIDYYYNLSASWGFARFGCITTNKIGYYINPVPTVVLSSPFTLDFDDFLDYPFLRNDRWCNIQVVTPFGYCDLPIDCLYDSSEYTITSAINLATGSMSIRLTEGDSQDSLALATFSGCIGVDMTSQLGTGVGFRQGAQNAAKFGLSLGLSAATAGMSMGASYNSTLSSLNNSTNLSSLSGSAFADQLAANKQAASISAISSGINSIGSLPTSKNGKCGSADISGGIESLLLSSTPGTCSVVRKVFMPECLGNVDSYTDFCDAYGYPLNKNTLLKNAGGYVKCSGAFVRDIPGATPQDISSINSFLNNGIIIEA